LLAGWLLTFVLLVPALAVSPVLHATSIFMVIEIRTVELQMLPLIANLMKPQIGGLWICGVPN